MMRFLKCAMPLLVVATPAFAQSASTEAVAVAAPSTVSADAPAKPKKVCRKFAVTGQRIAKSLCYSAAQWAELDARNEQKAKDYVNSVGNVAGKTGPGSSSNGALGTNPLFGLGN